MAAHEQLEELILDRDTMEAKKETWQPVCSGCIRRKMVHTASRSNPGISLKSTQKYVTGEVKFKLYKGNIIKAGTTSPYSLYNESLASFTTGDMYDHHDADGFITPVRSSAESSCNEITGSTEKPEQQIIDFYRSGSCRSDRFFCKKELFLLL